MFNQVEFDVRCEWGANGVAALAAFRGAEHSLDELLRQCSSGKELIAMGFGDDIAMTAELDADDCVPVLKDGAYTWTNRDGSDE